MERPPIDLTCAQVSPAPDASLLRLQRRPAYRLRAWIALALLAPFALAAISEPAPLPRSSPWAALLEAAGWAAFFAYAALRLWATLYVAGRKDLELQVHGPYSLCRNPLYLASFSLALSVAAFLQSAALLGAVAAVAALHAALIVLPEERLLRLRFGAAYAEYALVTPRFLPRFRRPSGPAVLAVDVRRLLAEFARLGRAALLILIVHALANARAS